MHDAADNMQGARGVCALRALVSLRKYLPLP